MNPLLAIRRRIIVLTTGLLFFLLIMWLLTPYQAQIAGLILGILVSLFNALYLSYKLKSIGERVIAGDTKVRGTGMINRFFMVAFAILFAVHDQEHFDVFMVIAGLPTVNVLAIFAGIANYEKERGESPKWN